MGGFEAREMMKTLKEPRPFCCSFLLPLSPLSRRRRVAFCAFNQQLFLSSRDFECFLTLSLSLFLAKQPKKGEPSMQRRPKFFVPRIKKKSSPRSSLHQKGGERSHACFFIFCEHRPTAGIWIRKDTQKPRYFHRN